MPATGKPRCRESTELTKNLGVVRRPSSNLGKPIRGPGQPNPLSKKLAHVGIGKGPAVDFPLNQANSLQSLELSIDFGEPHAGRPADSVSGQRSEGIGKDGQHPHPSLATEHGHKLSIDV